MFFLIPSEISCLCGSLEDDHEETVEGKANPFVVSLASIFHGLEKEILKVRKVYLFIYFYSGGDTVQPKQKKPKAPPALLEWNVVHKQMPWNIVLLLGGGYALATGSEVKK